jgi:hypothetical protein
MNFATSVTDPDPRIRTLDYGSGSSSESGSCYFVSDFQDANKKYFYFLYVFLYYFL